MKKRIFAFLLLFLSSSFPVYPDTVKGRIIQSDNSSVSGARITFYSFQPKFRKTGNADKNGYFTVRDIPSGYYNIEIAAKGFCMEHVTRFEVNEAKHGVVSPSFRIYRPGSVSGYVYDEKNNPLSGIKVNNAVTNGKGFYSISWLKPGTVHITASSRNRVRTYKTATVEESKDTGGINFTLPEGGSVSGKVLSKETGKPLRNARINIWGDSHGYASTDNQGVFLVEGLTEGKYELGAYLQGYEYISVPHIRVVKKEISEVPAIRMWLRPETFSLYDRNWVFTESEKVYMIYNSFRVKKCNISVAKIDLENEIGKLSPEARKSYGGNIRQAVNFFNMEGKEAVWKKDVDIGYPHPLSDIYNRKIEIGSLPSGVYVASVKPERLPEQRLLFMVTNLAVISRTDENKTVIYACDINTGKPLNEVRLLFLDRNLAVTGERLTGKDGLLEVNEKYHRLIASKGNSFAYLAWEYSSPGRNPLKTYLYTDRPVYRPGQTVFFKGILREETGPSYKIAEKEKAAVAVRDPQGNSFYTATPDVTPTGSFHGSFTLPEEPPLGDYTISSGQDSCLFKVLEYRKPEYSVTVSTDKARYLPGDKISALVRAQYYFGAPLVNGEISYSVYERSINRYYYDEYEGEDYYGYGWWGYGTQVLAGNAATNDKGEALIEIPLKSSYETESVYTIEARVVDSSRREVKAAGSATVVPGTFRIRVKTEKYICRPLEEIPVSISITDYEKRPVAARSLDFSAGLEIYENRKVSFNEFLKKEIVTDRDGRAVVNVKAEKAGHMKILVRGKDELNNLVTGNSYVWVTGKGYPVTWSGSRQIEVILDREKYKAGDTVTVLVNSEVADIPLLFSLERSKIYRQQVVRLEGHSGLFEFKVEKEHIPNLYFTVTGVHGKKYYTSSKVINISPEEYFLNVDIKTDRGKYLPGEKARYGITTKDFKGAPVPAEISFGLVDESIYAVSDEMVPRIEDFFYGKKANTIASSYSFYEWLYAGAGKDGLADGIRRNFRDTAYWKPYIITGRDGFASLDITLPDNLTTWRATARGVTAETLAGTAVQKVISSKPLVARLITPRFFVEDDRLFITGVIHNYTEETLALEAGLSAEGIEILDASSRRIQVPAGGQATINWQVKAGNGEKAVISLKAISEKAEDAMELTLPILPYGQEVFQSRSGEVDPVSSDTFFISSSAVPRTVKLETFIYPSIASGLFRNLDYLARYPYGCVEQTMSRFIPLVYVASTLRKAGIEDLSFLADDAEKFKKMLLEMPDMVRTGLSRLYASQNGDGGWGWWTRDTSRPYTSAYVLYGLSFAGKTGYSVDAERMKRAKTFLKGILEKIDNPDERTYILFALSQSGEILKKEIEEIYEKRAEINSYSLSLLTLIYFEQKNNARAAELLEELYGKKSSLTSSMSFWKTEKEGCYNWTNNDIETTAWALKATLAVDPRREEIPGIIRYLLWREKAGFWRSTKDTAVCVLALTDFLRAGDELSPDYSISLTANGKKVTDTKVTKDTLKQFSTVIPTPVSMLDPGSQNALTLSKEGKGAAYYTHNLKYFEKGSFIKPINDGFGVDRKYFKILKEPNGQGGYKERQEEMGDTVRVGDIIKVQITVTGKDAYRYIMVEDMLPAGCEVTDQEDPDGWYARREVRDEKVAFFAFSFGSEEQGFTYMLRAETPGRYHMLPARASMMYLPEIWGQSSENFLTITEK